MNKKAFLEKAMTRDISRTGVSGSALRRSVRRPLLGKKCNAHFRYWPVHKG